MDFYKHSLMRNNDTLLLILQSKTTEKKPEPNKTWSVECGEFIFSS